jgi:hypothetical protein
VIEIHSYRRVFELERRVYRVDRLRLNPSGVPVRGVVYFLALVAASMVASALPFLAVLGHALPWYVRALVLPGVGAGLLAVIRVEGRPFHLAARAMVGYRVAPRRLIGVARGASVGARWLPSDILILPDGSDAGIRGLSYTGPGAALVTVEHEQVVDSRNGRLPRRLWPHRSRAALTLRARSGRLPLAEGQVIVLERGARLLSSTG